MVISISLISSLYFHPFQTVFYVSLDGHFNFTYFQLVFSPIPDSILCFIGWSFQFHLFPACIFTHSRQYSMFHWMVISISLISSLYFHPFQTVFYVSLDGHFNFTYFKLVFSPIPDSILCFIGWS